MRCRTLSLLLLSLLVVPAALAQSGEWTTYGHDPQRSGFASGEHAFSPANASGLGLMWKTVVPNQPLFVNGLTAPLLVREVKTPTGPKSLVLVAGSSDQIYALNAEDGSLAWKQDFSGKQTLPEGSGWLCPSALNDTPVIDKPHDRVFVVSADGHLHTLALSDGHALIPPMQFVPPYSKMWSLNYSGGVLYSSISQGCNHATSGVAALNPDAPGRPVTFFYSAVFGGAGIWGRGGISTDSKGFLYGATGDAPFDAAAGEFGDTVLKLEPKTLQLAGYYTPSIWQYLTRRDLDMGTSTPVVFLWRDRVLTAVGGKEGAVYLTDTSAMSGPDHHQTAYVSPRYTNIKQTFERNGIWGEMSVWKDPQGQTWLYVPSWGLLSDDAKFPKSYGPIQDGSLMAFQVVPAAGGKPSLRPAWVSAEISVPDPAVIAGGVVFVLGTGENTQQVNNGDINQLLGDRESRAAGHAILHALDARSGKELWSSGETIQSWTHFSGLAVGDGKIIATTHDGAVYAFGLRSATSPAPSLTVLPQSPLAVQKTSAKQDKPAAAAGGLPQCGDATVTFTQRCAMCHGADGRGLAGARTPNFTDAAWQESKTDKTLIDTLTNGNEAGMPAFGGALSTPEIDKLIHCVVRGLGTPAGR